MECGQSSSESLQNSYELNSATINIEEACYSSLSEQAYCPNDDYHINNRHREDPQTYIAKHVHNEQLFLCRHEVVCDSDTAPT